MRKPRQFLNEKEENREIQNIPPELNELLSQFFYSLRKSDGTEYEPRSLRGMICSFDRVLKYLRYVATEKMLNLLGHERCLGLSKSNL